MTRSEILTLVRSILQEPSAKKWTDANLVTMIDDAVEEIYGIIAFECDGNWYVERATTDTNIVAGTAQYAWPTKGTTPVRNMIRLDRVERVNTTYPWDLVVISKEDRHRYISSTGDYPLQMYVEAPYVWLVPTPTVSVTGGLRFHGVWEHGALAATSSSPSFPTRYHPLVAYRAAMDALGVDETSPMWAARKYASGLRKLVTEMTPSMIGTIRDTSDD